MAKQPNINPMVVNFLQKKAAKSDCTYKVSGTAYDKKGNILGHAVNKHSKWDVLEKEHGIGRSGTARHVERILINQYGKRIKTIVICRVGHGGSLRPINACPTCRKVAAKLGIKIISISGENDEL